MAVLISTLADELGVTERALYRAISKAHSVWPACFKIKLEKRKGNNRSYISDADASELKDIYKFKNAAVPKRGKK